jgi:predicted permease
MLMAPQLGETERQADAGTSWAPAILIFVGLVLLVSFAGAGIIDLFFPLPPSWKRGPGAAFLCLEGVVLMAITHCIAFFLGILYTARTLKEGRDIWAAMFNVLSQGMTLVKPARRSGSKGGSGAAPKPLRTPEMG